MTALRGYCLFIGCANYSMKANSRVLFFHGLKDHAFFPTYPNILVGHIPTFSTITDVMAHALSPPILTTVSSIKMGGDEHLLTNTVYDYVIKQ